MSSTVDDRRPPTADPDRDAATDAAARWLDAELGGQAVPPLLVVIGLSDATLLSFLERRAPAAKLLAFEPDPEVAARVLRHPDTQRWRESGRLVYLVDPDYEGADEAWRAFPSSPDAHRLIVRPDIMLTATAGAVRAARAYKQILFGVRANAEARRKFSPGYLAGSLHNLPEILAGHDVRSLVNAYRGVPAIVAAAGPSLDDVADDLAAVADRGVLIAADTALRPLRSRGLSPQFVVAVDPQATNARHFHELPPCPDTWLVSEASIDPSVVAPFGRRTLWFRVSNHEPWSWYNEMGLDVGRIDVWGSVVTAAFQIAVLAGCDPIVFVGTDLSFTGGHPYARGTTYEFDWAHLAAEGQPLEQAWRPFLRRDEQIRVPDVHGVKTVSTPSMQSFRDWLVARAQKSGRRVVNATGAGILLGGGIERASLREVLTTARRVLPPAEVLAAATARPARGDVARRLWDVHRSVCRNAQSTPPLDRWKAFCGEGFALASIGAAVERAARVLEAPEVAPAASSTTIPWLGLASGAAAHEVVRHLPEATSRWRSVLAGTPVATKPVAADAAAAVTDAFAVLRSICRTASTTTLSTSVPAEHVGRWPLGALHTWPVELGRAVRLFEALLGVSWPASSPPPAPETSFFTRHVVLRREAVLPGGLRQEGQTPNAPNLWKTPLTPSGTACAGLALEWLLAATRVESATTPAAMHAIARWRGLVAAVTTAAAETASTETKATGHPVSLVLDADDSDPIELPLAVGDAALARVLTGSARAGGTPAATSVSLLVRVATLSRHSSIALRTTGGVISPALAPMATPRVLTDEGVVRGVVPYSIGHSAVCTALRGSESFLVHEDGSTEPGLAWPRPAVGELPFGDSGAVAWGVGNARWPDGGSGYVMYRRTPASAATVEALPFAPQAGTWWRDRFYWACFPFGVGSWAPGIEPAFAFPDRMLFSVLDGESGLMLNPRARTSDGAAERRVITQGWRWQPGQDAQPVSLDPLGVVSTRSVAHGWTAAAHPEADAIQLSKNGVSVTLTCYYPFGVAWAGRSLLVSTADGELLLFERFTEILDAWTGGRR